MRETVTNVTKGAENPANVYVLEHPIVSHNMAALRDADYNPEKYRLALKRVLTLLIYEGTKFLPTVKKSITTPICPTEVDVFDEQTEITLAPILRAGLAFCEIAQEILPMASVQHLGMYRDEKTLTPVWYYNKTFTNPKNPEKNFVFILDPMIATGNSISDAIAGYVNKNIPEENIVCISLLAAPEGIKKVREKFAKVKIVTSNIDEGLDARGYIVPGLGDAGDKAFNTQSM